MKIPKEMRCQNCSDHYCEPPHKKDAPPTVKEGTSEEAYRSQEQPKPSQDHTLAQPHPGGGWTAGPFLTAPAPPVILMGPPVSRRKQRELGIERFVPGVGYEKRLCPRCQKHLWLGPTQLQTLERSPGTQIICTACILPQLKAGLKDGTIALNHLGGRGPAYYQHGKYFGPPEEVNN
jgi:hypothetical protein